MRRSRWIVMGVVGLMGLLWAGSCTLTRTIPPVHSHAPVTLPTYETVQFVLLGDTGYKSGILEQLVETIVANEPDRDLAVVLGDLIYNTGPKCPDGLAEGDVLALMDERIGEPLRGLEVPVLLNVGNHDVARFFESVGRSVPREACYLDYIAQPKNDHLIMPALDYTLDLGVAAVAIINSMAYNLDARTAEVVRRGYAGHDGWHLLFSHHGLKIIHDKVGEDEVAEWLAKEELSPDLIANGHAHLLQFGVYQLGDMAAPVLALTSGSGSKLRSRDECGYAEADPAVPCDPAGQRFGASRYGYAVLTVAPEQLTVVFKDVEGTPLWGCESVRGSRDCIAIAPDRLAAP